MMMSWVDVPSLVIICQRLLKLTSCLASSRSNLIGCSRQTVLISKIYSVFRQAWPVDHLCLVERRLDNICGRRYILKAFDINQDSVKSIMAQKDDIGCVSIKGGHFEGSFKCGRQMQPSFPGFEGSTGWNIHGPTYPKIHCALDFFRNGVRESGSGSCSKLHIQRQNYVNIFFTLK